MGMVLARLFDGANCGARDGGPGTRLGPPGGGPGMLRGTAAASGGGSCESDVIVWLCCGGMKPTSPRGLGESMALGGTSRGVGASAAPHTF